MYSVDGSFMFGVPSSVYWMSRRYEAPFLTVILNNKGLFLGVSPSGNS